MVVTGNGELGFDSGLLIFLILRHFRRIDPTKTIFKTFLNQTVATLFLVLVLQLVISFVIFLDVVAISQAPSPESNPNSPLPDTTMALLYPTLESG